MVIECFYLKKKKEIKEKPYFSLIISSNILGSVKIRDASPTYDAFNLNKIEKIQPQVIETSYRLEEKAFQTVG